MEIAPSENADVVVDRDARGFRSCAVTFLVIGSALCVALVAGTTRNGLNAEGWQSVDAVAAVVISMLMIAHESDRHSTRDPRM